MIRKQLLDLVKSFEGCRLEAYKDIVGVPTIGYGFTSGVKLGDTITQQEADARLETELETFQTQVQHLLRTPVTDNQLDALTDFAYNLGVHALATSTLLKLVQSGKFDEAAEEFSKWTHAGGVEVAGLVRRRSVERQMFLA